LYDNLRLEAERVAQAVSNLERTLRMLRVDVVKLGVNLPGGISSSIVLAFSRERILSEAPSAMTEYFTNISVKDEG